MPLQWHSDLNLHSQIRKLKLTLNEFGHIHSYAFHEENKYQQQASLLDETYCIWIEWTNTDSKQLTQIIHLTTACSKAKLVR